MLFIIIPLGLLAGIAGLSPVAAVAMCATWQAVAAYLVTKKTSQLQAALAMAMVSAAHFVLLPVILQAAAPGAELGWFSKVAPMMPSVIVFVGIVSIINSTVVGMLGSLE